MAKNDPVNVGFGGAYESGIADEGGLGRAVGDPASYPIQRVNWRFSARGEQG